MHVYFRADAAPNIGSGHIARCLTLAQTLAAQGAAIHFVCQRIPENLAALISQQGFSVNHLPIGSQTSDAWLTTSQAEDAQATGEALTKMPAPDWVVVDHYGIDQEWENHVGERVPHIGVIDDLADRPHQCDLLLDQNYGRNSSDYNALVPGHCRRLIGPKFALLRAEFSELRPSALARRPSAEMSRILITMGGFDPDNLTELTLRALPTELLGNTEIDVILGSGAPHRQAVADFCSNSSLNATLNVDVHDMAQRMVAADLAIGAGGTSSWERCCLGLPTLVLCMAENQRLIAKSLGRAGAAHYLGDMNKLTQAPDTITRAVQDLATSSEVRQSMSAIAASLVDGQGAARVAQMLQELS